MIDDIYYENELLPLLCQKYLKKLLNDFSVSLSTLVEQTNRNYPRSNRSFANNGGYAAETETYHFDVNANAGSFESPNGINRYQII